MPDTRRTAHESPREPNVGQQSLLQPIIPSLRYSCDLAQQASPTSFFLRFLIIVRTHLLFLFSWLSCAGGSFWGGNGEMNAWGRIFGGGCSREWTMVAKLVRVVSRLWSEQLRVAREVLAKRQREASEQPVKESRSAPVSSCLSHPDGIGECSVIRSSLSLAAEGLEAGATPPRQTRGIGRTKGRIVVARPGWRWDGRRRWGTRLACQPSDRWVMH